MSSIRLPGPVCQFLASLEIDGGTLCRTASPRPGSLNTVIPAQSTANKNDVPIDAGRKIVAEAKAWKGTPYLLVGNASAKGTGGDCSGSTQKIYKAAGFPYEYRNSGTFPAYAAKSGLFRELREKEVRQDGDILSWPGHMAIYSTFATDPDNARTERVNKQGQTWIQNNDMWTASHPPRNTDDIPPPYSPAEMRFWKLGPPRVFRYQR
jgi:cell wall-associated NlpC family hydrolase